MKLFFKRPNILILYEISGFGIIILFLWLDEIFDIPAHLFGSMQTPVNIPESILETVFILLVGARTARRNYMVIRIGTVSQG